MSPHQASPYQAPPYANLPYGAPPPGYLPAPAYPGSYPSPWGQPQKTNPLAITSLVTALLPFLVITPLVAVITGHIARRQIRDRHEKGEGLALAGLIIGYIFGAGILAAIVIPVFLNQSDVRHDRIAQDDLRNAATAEESYLTDNGVYTSDVTSLSIGGFRPSDGTTIVAHADRALGYCLVASQSGSPHWFLYDSQRGGLSYVAYDNMSVAELACSLPAYT